MLNLKTFQHALENIYADFRKVKFLLAISGGADSMVLLHLYKSLGLQFQVAHINYKLRDAESDKDQKLVESICEQNRIPFHLYQVSEKDNKPLNSIQDWARIIRYDFFRQIQCEQSLDFIVTAHHLNDQLETFIIHLSKASGIKGLSGIPANENNILRPLLGFSKEDIYDFAKENSIEFREDLSNQKNDYLRNKIRNQIVPKLLEVNENFLDNFSKSITYLNQTKNFVEQQVSEIEKEIILHQEDASLINKASFLDQTDFVQYEILRKYGFNDLKENLKIKKAETGKIFISSAYELIIDRKILLLKKSIKGGEQLNEEEITLEIDAKNQIIFPENLHFEINELGKVNWKLEADKIKLPLRIRHQKDGDLFHPMGMVGKKKIAKFFKDEKIPIFTQQKIWLLCDGNNQVLGVLPFRQDRRFAKSNESSKIIKVKL